MNQEAISSQALCYNIEWRFNPPTASHMGGSWERLIRSVRQILSGLLTEHDGRLDDEALRTLLCEVECIINSRPISTVASHPGDLKALTPNQLLNLKVVLSPPGQFDGLDLKRRWRRVQYLTGIFWSRFKREYLSNLQRRKKWQQPQRNMREGDVVLLRDETTPRYKWPLARITTTMSDSNGTVRSAKIKLADKELHRPINKLVLLIPQEEQ